MSSTTPEAKESIDTIDDRDVRALTRHVSVLGGFGDAGPSEYVVVGESGTERHVDVDVGACDCPDHEHRGVRCYHLRAVDFATGRRPIPTWVDDEAINNSLGEHIDESPVFEREAVTDGGMVATAPQGSGPETTHAPGCENPECEGLDADAERPLLSFACWDQWAAYSEEELIEEASQ